MTRPSRRRLLVALATGGVCVGALLSGMPAAAALTAPPGSLAQPAPSVTSSPTPAPVDPETPAAEDVPDIPEDPLLVVIERLTPSSLPTDGYVRVSGTVRNLSDETWTDLAAYLFSSYDPITTAEELTAAVASDPRTDVGPRIIEPGLFTELDELAPGEKTSFSLKVPVEELVMSGEPGVYWIGVHVLGTNSLGRLEGADGRARTFIPLVPGRRPRSALGLGIQFRNHTVRAPDGRLEEPERWQATFSRGGRLRRLLDLASTSSPARPVAWVADPALVNAAESVVRGNPPLALAPTVDPDDGEPVEEEAEDAEGEPTEADAEVEPTEAPGPQQAAAEWIEKFISEAGDRSFLTLPYGDLDVSSVVRHDEPELLISAFGAGTALLEDRDVTASPVLLPPSGLLSPEALTVLEPGLPVVLSRAAVTRPSRGPLLTRADGGRILQTPVAEDLWGPAPGRTRTALAVRQRLLADAALHALSGDRDQPLVRFLPPAWDPGHRWRRARFFEGLDVPWLSAVDVGTMLNGLGTLPTDASREPEDPIEPAEDVWYPDEEAVDELPLTTVLATEALGAEGAAVEELITEDSDVDEQLGRQALLTSSFWSRFRPGLAAARAVAARERVTSWLDEITVSTPAFVTMSSETGTFQVTVHNGLDQRVTVGLRASVADSDLELSTTEPIELPPNGRGSMRIDARSSGIGVHLVSLQPVTVDGTPIGEPARVSIRSSRVGLILWIVIGVGGSALFVAIALRIWRRVRRRRRTHGPRLRRAQT